MPRFFILFIKQELNIYALLKIFIRVTTLKMRFINNLSIFFLYKYGILNWFDICIIVAKYIKFVYYKVNI